MSKLRRCVTLVRSLALAASSGFATAAFITGAPELRGFSRERLERGRGGSMHLHGCVTSLFRENLDGRYHTFHGNACERILFGSFPPTGAKRRDKFPCRCGRDRMARPVAIKMRLLSLWPRLPGLEDLPYRSKRAQRTPRGPSSVPGKPPPLKKNIWK